jgi:glycosyltransferase involved in cell wall biosynthesis
MILSIITVNKNNSVGLEKTINSVICQSFNDYEYIIIDGASNDNSVEIIKNYSSKINYWVSEPDSGIYNAMNKGIRIAHGDYCLFLNSGDFIVNENTLNELFKELSNTEEAGIYYADRISTKQLYLSFPKKIDINFLIIHNLNHQNTLIKRSLFLEHGYYNENFKISSDYEFWLREFWIFRTLFKYIYTNITIYDSSGISSTSKFDYEINEAIRITFGSLSDALIKYRNLSHSPYAIIVEKYGPRIFLDFILKCYKHFLNIFFNKKLYLK